MQVPGLLELGLLRILSEVRQTLIVDNRPFQHIGVHRECWLAVGLLVARLVADHWVTHDSSAPGRVSLGLRISRLDFLLWLTFLVERVHLSCCGVW